MEETVSERQTTMESLRSQLAAVLEEHALCGRELGGRREGVESQGDAVEGEGCVRCVCVNCVCVCACVGCCHSNSMLSHPHTLTCRRR